MSVVPQFFVGDTDERVFQPRQRRVARLGALLFVADFHAAVNAQMRAVRVARRHDVPVNLRDVRLNVGHDLPRSLARLELVFIPRNELACLRMLNEALHFLKAVSMSGVACTPI